MTSPTKPNDPLDYDVHQDVIVGDFRLLIRSAQSMTWWVLVGPHGAVQFAYMTLPPDAPSLSMMKSYRPLADGTRVMPTDVGTHRFEGNGDDYDTQLECDLLPGQSVCHYDGSGLAADRWMHTWQGAGGAPETMWAMLLAHYGAVLAPNLSMRAIAPALEKAGIMKPKP